MSSKYKIGDKVRVLEGCGDLELYIGAVGTVSETNDDPLWCKITFSNGVEIFCNENTRFRDKLELVEEKELQLIDLDYKQGDVVKCVAIDISCQRDREDFASGKQKNPLVVGALYQVTELKIASHGRYVTVVSVGGDGVCVSGTYAHQFSKVNINNNKTNIMSNIKSFVKNMLLTGDEKALREVGFKTECGDYTDEAIDVLLQELCAEKEARLIEIAKAIIADKKDK